MASKKLEYVLVKEPLVDGSALDTSRGHVHACFTPIPRGAVPFFVAEATEVYAPLEFNRTMHLWVDEKGEGTIISLSRPELAEKNP